MTSRFGKTAVVLLLGLVLAWQGLFPASATARQTPDDRSNACCRSGSQCANCTTPACCARPTEPSSPSAPISANFSSQNEWQAIAPPLAGTLALYSPSCGELRFSLPPSPVTEVPLFQ